MSHKDDFNGLVVGDVIYNEHRDGLFVIGLFDFERIVTRPDEEHPYIVGYQITVDESGIEIAEEGVPVSIKGSAKLTRNDVNHMIREHVAASNDKLEALQELADMTE